MKAYVERAAARSPNAGTVREWRNNTLAAAADTAMRLTIAGIRNGRGPCAVNELSELARSRQNPMRGSPCSLINRDVRTKPPRRNAGTILRIDGPCRLRAALEQRSVLAEREQGGSTPRQDQRAVDPELPVPIEGPALRLRVKSHGSDLSGGSRPPRRRRAASAP